jgi:hypothetical protein
MRRKSSSGTLKTSVIAGLKIDVEALFDELKNLAAPGVVIAAR